MPDADDRGFTGPIEPPASQQVDYQRAIWVPAHRSNFRKSTGPRVIKNVVIHITDGAGSAFGTASYFHNEAIETSAHYVVGLRGEVIQMVREVDVAWHAHSVNSYTIGIEHEARTKGDDKQHPEAILPTPSLYAASAALVADICDRHKLPRDRVTIQGHKQIDPKLTHDDCPDGVWDWEVYMRMVTGAGATSGPTAPAPLYALRWGAEGKEVRTLQAALGRLGFRCGSDGNFGPETETALNDLQRKCGFPITRVADATVLWKIAALLEALRGVGATCAR